MMKLLKQVKMPNKNTLTLMEAIEAINHSDLEQLKQLRCQTPPRGDWNLHSKKSNVRQ